MSYCSKCGSKFENGGFRCPKCGSLLAYTPSGRGPSLWMKLKGYKNVGILIALALLIVAVRAVAVVTIAYWLIIAGIAGYVLYRWLKGRRPQRSYAPPRHPNSTVGNNRYGAQRPTRMQSGPANVIPFKKKRNPKSKARPD